MSSSLLRQIRKRRAIQNCGSRVSSRKKSAKQLHVFVLIFLVMVLRLGVSEWSEWAVHDANHFVEGNFSGRSLQAITTVGPARAFDDGSVLQFEQDEF